MMCNWFLKLFLSVIFIFGLASTLGAAAAIDSMATGVSILGTAADTSAVWPIQYGENFAIQVKAAGDTIDIKVQYQLSYDGSAWGYEAGTGATDPLIASFTSTSWNIYDFSPFAAPYVRFIVTGNAGNGGDGTSYWLVAMKRAN